MDSIPACQLCAADWLRPIHEKLPRPLAPSTTSDRLTTNWPKPNQLHPGVVMRSCTRAGTTSIHQLIWGNTLVKLCDCATSILLFVYVVFIWQTNFYLDTTCAHSLLCAKYPCIWSSLLNADLLDIGQEQDWNRGWFVIDYAKEKGHNSQSISDKGF